MVTEGRTADRVGYWEQVVRDACALPPEPPLDELTVELGRLLGSPDAHERDEIAYTVLSAWIARGVYDELLTGLGDGMCAGLRSGLGEHDTDSVFRRSFSCLVLTELVTRDNEAGLLHPETVLRWGDRALGWFVRERDLRGWVPGKGWAHTLAHGADLLLALGLSHHLGAGELGVLLDALADRLLAPTAFRTVGGEDDRLAYATMAILHRNQLDMETLRPWVERLAAGVVVTRSAAMGRGRPAADGNPPVPPAPPAGGTGDETADEATATAFNVVSYLRALYLQLQLGVRPVSGAKAARVFTRDVEARIDLLGALARELRSIGPLYRPAGTG